MRMTNQNPDVKIPQEPDDAVAMVEEEMDGGEELDGTL